MGLMGGLMTQNLFLKKDTGILRRVGICSAERDKKSRFVWDGGGPYEVKFHIPNIHNTPILQCHSSGGEAFFGKNETINNT